MAFQLASWSYGAAERGQGRRPLLIIPRFTSPKVYAQCAKVGCAGRLGGAAEHVCSPGDLEIDKTGCYDRSLELCFQQSAGNSTCPQIDLAPGALRDWLLHQDVADLQPPLRP